MSTLTLVQVQTDQTGSYTATVSNDDDTDEIIFNLEVKGQRVYVWVCLYVCIWGGVTKEKTHVHTVTIYCEHPVTSHPHTSVHTCDS